MVEPSGEAKHQLKDKGYKKLFENKEMFVEFLQTFVQEEWVKDINKDDLVRVDKEYVLKDYRKKMNLPGFRPGMIPMTVVKKKYGVAVTI